MRTIRYGGHFLYTAFQTSGALIFIIKVRWEIVDI
jgi:hypothetical protein